MPGTLPVDWRFALVATHPTSQYGTSKDFQGLGDLLPCIPYHLGAGRCPV